MNERLKIYVRTEKLHGVEGLFELYILPVGKNLLTGHSYCDIVNFKFEESLFSVDIMKLLDTVTWDTTYPRFSLDIQVDLSEEEFNHLHKLIGAYGELSYIRRKVTIDMGEGVDL